MKVFVLGLDGLEYDFVERWNLVHLKQEQYARIKVPINRKTEVPMTPEVWAAFLAGKHMPRSFVPEKPLAPLTLLYELVGLIRRRIIKPNTGLTLRIKYSVPKEIHGQYFIKGPSFTEKTFLDLTDSREFNAPYYSKKPLDIEETLRAFGVGKISLKQAIGSINKVYSELKRQLIKSLEEARKVDVFFAYLNFPDLVEHFLLPAFSRVKEHYFDLNNYVSVLKDKISDSTLFLIVSDHGFDFKTETHSLHGFYSSNRSLKPKPQLITDFFNIILKEVRSNSNVHNG